MFEATQGESPGETAPTADALESSLAQVVELARAGDGHAFRDLFQKYNGTLYFAATTVSVSSISIVDTSKHVTPTPSITTSVASTDIYAINANDGSQRWHLHPTNNDGYASDVQAMDENVYLSVGGRLYALSEKDGRQLWTISEGINLGTPLTV